MCVRVEVTVKWFLFGVFGLFPFFFRLIPRIYSVSSWLFLLLNNVLLCGFAIFSPLFYLLVQCFGLVPDYSIQQSHYIT